MGDRISVRDRLAAIESNEAAAIAKIRRMSADELAILSALPPDLAVNGVHPYSLYGRVGTVIVGGSFRDDANDCTWDQLIGLVRRFPPVPMVIHRDGCTSIQTAAYAESKDPDGEKDTDIFGVTIHCENSEHSGELCKVEWCSEVAPGVVVELNAIMKYAERPARMAVDWSRAAVGHGQIIGFKRVQLIASTGFAKESDIKYGGGSNTDPGHYVLYWSPCGPDTTAADYLAGLWKRPAAAGGAA